MTCQNIPQTHDTYLSLQVLSSHISYSQSMLIVWTLSAQPQIILLRLLGQVSLLPRV